MAGRLFVANFGEDTISVIDAYAKKQQHKIVLSHRQQHYTEAGTHLKKSVIGPHSLKCGRDKEYIYSVDCFDDSIAVINTSSMDVEEFFFAGNHPNDMAFSSDDSYIYVTNGDSDSVSVIDALARKIIFQVSVGAMPHGICISPSGEYVYTADMDSNTVSMIDTWSNSKVTCIKVGKCPVEVVPSADGRYVFAICSYLGNDRNGTVSVISTHNYSVIKTIDIGMIPIQGAISNDGRMLFVTNMGSNDVYAIDLNRFEVIRVIESGNMARGIAIREDGHIFVSNSEDNNLSIIDHVSWEISYNIEVGIEPTSMLYIK